MIIRKYQGSDLEQMLDIWNEVVGEGDSFPQIETLDREEGARFFAEQSLTAVAVDEDDGAICGLYILHPNNVGRCGHIANASYAVKKGMRGRGIGGRLVSDSLLQGAGLGYRVLQFNAVVKTNQAAILLYEKLGFVRLGVIPGGFMKKDGSYEDIIPMYHVLGQVER